MRDSGPLPTCGEGACFVLRLSHVVEGVQDGDQST